jgi:hypothetical protein
VIGRTGRVTGRVAPGAVGEVTLQIRGGSEAFYAYASVEGVIIDKGVKVKVDDYQPPLTVFVSPIEPTPPGPQEYRPRSLIQDTVPSPAPHHSYTAGAAANRERVTTGKHHNRNAARLSG